MILDLTVDGDERATRHLHGLAERAGDLQPMFELMAPALYASERRKFDKGFTKSTVIGTELRLTGYGTAAERIRVRKRRKRSRYSLVDTGRLRASLTLRGDQDTIFDTSSNQLRFGTGVFYARFLRKRGFKLLPIDQRLRSDLTSTARDYLLGGAE